MKGQKSIHIVGGLVLTVLVVTVLYSIVSGEFDAASGILEQMMGGKIK